MVCCCFQVVKDYLADPLNTTGNTAIRTGATVLGAFRALKPLTPMFTLPILAVHGTNVREGRGDAWGKESEAGGKARGVGGVAIIVVLHAWPCFKLLQCKAVGARSIR